MRLDDCLRAAPPAVSGRSGWNSVGHAMAAQTYLMCCSRIRPRPGPNCLAFIHSKGASLRAARISQGHPGVKKTKRRGPRTVGNRLEVMNRETARGEPVAGWRCCSFLSYPTLRKCDLVTRIWWQIWQTSGTRFPAQGAVKPSVRCPRESDGTP